MVQKIAKYCVKSINSETIIQLIYNILINFAHYKKAMFT